MPFIPTALPGVVIFEPKVFGDSRGYFFESYNANVFKEAGIDVTFVQDNESRSNYGVLRGLHFQQAPYMQAKLVRVAQGKVLDVVVDIRAGSPHFGRWISVELSGENRRQIFVPRGYAHGFVSLSEEVVLLYKCDNFYNPASEAGIRYDDAALNIDWQIPAKDICLSPKDEKLPALSFVGKIGQI
jgi:dTDP-4-dehydrorhamnose 3,5-epimerase